MGSQKPERAGKMPRDDEMRTGPRTHPEEHQQSRGSQEMTEKWCPERSGGKNQERSSTEGGGTHTVR